MKVEKTFAYALILLGMVFIGIGFALGSISYEKSSRYGPIRIFPYYDAAMSLILFSIILFGIGAGILYFVRKKV